MIQELQYSIIIPTFNRKEVLYRTLVGLTKQSLAPKNFEVIIVDDGSTDGTEKLNFDELNLNVQFYKQENRGAAQARNIGALNSSGDVLVFIDDDILLEPQTLQKLVEECQKESEIILGNIKIPPAIHSAIPLEVLSCLETSQDQDEEKKFVEYVHCKTGLLTIKKDDFLKIGMFQDPTGGWPNWDDVDFGYRANLVGYKFILVLQAIGWHWDASVTCFDTFCKRMYNASKSAVILFEKYPDLQAHLPMFYDKSPIVLQKNSVILIIRKILRQFIATNFVLGILKLIVTHLAGLHFLRKFLLVTYRLIIGSYICRGFHEGFYDRSPAFHIKTFLRPNEQNFESQSSLIETVPPTHKVG